jgi:hypothetical protein
VSIHELIAYVLVGGLIVLFISLTPIIPGYYLFWFLVFLVTYWISYSWLIAGFLFVTGLFLTGIVKQLIARLARVRQTMNSHEPKDEPEGGSEDEWDPEG